MQMRRILIIFLIGVFLIGGMFLSQSNTSAQGISTTTPEPDTGSVVCPPGVNNPKLEDCLQLGPADYLARIVASGIPYPFPSRPEYSYSPPVDLNSSDFHYFHVTNEGVPLFGSLQDAIANQNYSRLGPGTELFVSYLGGPVKPLQGGTYYELRSGTWIPAEGSRFGDYAWPFQGLEFVSTPRITFGWVLGPIRTHSEPDVDSPVTGDPLYRYAVIQIYATREAGNMTWYLVRPDGWVDATQIRRVDPHTTVPAGVTGNRWIEVNLQEQTLLVYDNGQLVYATMSSTGQTPFWTRPGLFKIYEKKPTETMSGSTEADRSDYYYLEDVPWTMYFDEQRALHGAYWHNNFGYTMSHGCVNLSVGDAHWLYDWANINDFVYVYDPSGKTPVDPKVYGSGAP